MRVCRGLLFQRHLRLTQPADDPFHRMPFLCHLLASVSDPGTATISTYGLDPCWGSGQCAGVILPMTSVVGGGLCACGLTLLSEPTDELGRLVAKQLQFLGRVEPQGAAVVDDMKLGPLQFLGPGGLGLRQLGLGGLQVPQPC